MLYEIRGSHARDYLKNLPGLKLFVDTAHLVTEPWPDTVYIKACRWTDIVTALSAADGIDHVILDDYYTIQETPRPAMLFLNLARIAARQHYTIWLLNQSVYRPPTDRVEPRYNRYLKTYCDERYEIN